MQTQLENYLSKVEKNIQELPVGRKDDELKEMRGHLTNVVDAYREQGLSDEAATAAATEQFGTPKEIGRSVIGAWRRGEIRKSGFWASAAFVAITLWEAPHYISTCLPLVLKSLQLHHALSAWEILFLTFYSAVCFALVGGITGLLFSKRAMMVIVGGLLLHRIIGVSLMVYNSRAVHSPSQPWFVWLQLILHDILTVACAIMAVWVVSRWRAARNVRTNVLGYLSEA